MTESRHTAAGLPSSQLLGEPSLDTLAMTEMLAQMRAAGDVPRLSKLIAALPEAAGALADATMAESDESPTGQATGKGGTATQPIQLSQGTRQAIASIFPAGDILAREEHRTFQERDDTPAMVAEAAAHYSVSPGEPGEPGEAKAEGLLALARRQGVDTQTLAAHIMLSPEALHWLDRVALPLAHQPMALVFHLAGALGVSCERVQQALAHGETVIAATEFLSMFANDGFLTPTQRDYWLAVLSSNR